MASYWEYPVSHRATFHCPQARSSSAFKLKAFCGPPCLPGSSIGWIGFLGMAFGYSLLAWRLGTWGNASSLGGRANPSIERQWRASVLPLTPRHLASNARPSGTSVTCIRPCGLLPVATPARIRNSRRSMRPRPLRALIPSFARRHRPFHFGASRFEVAFISCTNGSLFCGLRLANWRRAFQRRFATTSMRRAKSYGGSSSIMDCGLTNRWRGRVKDKVPRSNVGVRGAKLNS